MRNKKRNIKTKKIWGIKVPLFMMPILVFFGVATILMTIEMASSGAVLASLEQEKAVLIRENEELSNKLINSASLKGLGQKAEELGFAKPSSVLYISEKEALAKLP